MRLVWRLGISKRHHVFWNDNFPEQGCDKLYRGRRYQRHVQDGWELELVESLWIRTRSARISASSGVAGIQADNAEEAYCLNVGCTRR